MLSDRDFARRAIGLIDLTDLSDDCTQETIDALLARALSLPTPVAALCIWPRFVKQAHARLAGSKIKLATVVNFPQGGEDIASVCAETQQAVSDGANEIDLVLPWRAFLDGRETVAHDMVARVAKCLLPSVNLKVILETGELKDEHAIRRAAELAIAGGAHVLKTSTGKTPVSATPEAARIMLETIRASRKDIGFKASGGLRTLQQARIYFDLAEEIMGRGWADAAHFRYGASGLLDALLAVLGGDSA